MENLNITKTAGGFHIEGFPNAVKIIQIDQPQSKKLADLFLHKTDLEFALRSLEEINGVPDQDLFLRQVFWRSAVVHYLKCFGGNKARSRLNKKEIYKKEDTTAFDAFEYFKNLRHKHIVHDENSYSQCIPGAILNQHNHSYKIEKIVCISATVNSLAQENYNNLHLLITVAMAWAVNEFDALCEILTKELEVKSYDSLLKMQSITYRPPTVDQVKNNRLKKLC